MSNNDGQQTTEEASGKKEQSRQATAAALDELAAQSQAIESDAARLPQAGPVNSFYGVAVMVPCDESRGGCGALIKLTRADAMNGAAQGITFRVPCPKCEAVVVSRPHPGSPRVARLGNRQQRRAARKSKGGIMLP